MTTIMIDEQILAVAARTIYESVAIVRNNYRKKTDSVPSWDRIGDDHKKAFTAAIKKRLMDPENDTGKEWHAAWFKSKIADGWTFGEILDRSRKLDPNLVAFENLPLLERLDFEIFSALVAVFKKSAVIELK